MNRYILQFHHNVSVLSILHLYHYYQQQYYYYYYHQYYYYLVVPNLII